MSYFEETDNYLNSHGGRGPACPNCGGTMFAIDDHGRFSCFCRGGMRTLDVVSGTTLDPKPIEATKKTKKKGK